MTVVFIGGTNGLLSQVAVRIDSITGVIKLKTVSDGALRFTKTPDRGRSGKSGWKGFYDDLPESTQEP